jgi:hypothetical protein
VRCALENLPTLTRGGAQIVVFGALENERRVTNGREAVAVQLLAAAVCATRFAEPGMRIIGRRTLCFIRLTIGTFLAAAGHERRGPTATGNAVVSGRRR